MTVIFFGMRKIMNKCNYNWKDNYFHLGTNLMVDCVYILPLIASRMLGSSSRKSLNEGPVNTVSLSSFRVFTARFSSAPYIPTSFDETSSLQEFI